METPRCLIVTQDRFLARLLDLLLDHGEYERRVLSDARAATRDIEAWRPHLAILDIDIDDGHGIDLVHDWKARGGTLPIIGVTRRKTIEARLGAFEHGIDDLLVIPCRGSPRAF
ncbi:MAG: response regulator [Chloroflexota bacterium]|nr:response regulator [Chloroflexota bacterium]